MNSTEIDWTDNGCGTVKSWLKGCFSFLVGLNIIALSGAMVLVNGQAIGVILISLVFDGLMLAAVIKQWRVILNIGTIVFFLGLMFSAMGIVLDSLRFLDIKGAATEEQENLFIVQTVILFTALFSNGFLFVLLVRYSVGLANASKAKSFNSKPIKVLSCSLAGEKNVQKYQKLKPEILLNSYY